MEYKTLLKYHSLYSTTKEDIIKREGFENILKDVVISPWWSHDFFEPLADKIEKIGSKVYNIYGKNFEFSFIEMKNVGAPAILDEVLSLGLTKCKNLVFIGSAGAIDPNIKIGEIAIPEFSFCGVGTCRYLNENLEDDFEKKDFPSAKLNKKIINILQKEQIKYHTKIINILQKEQIKYHTVKNYSVDAVFAQFPHIEHFISLGAQTLEMESSTVFRCASLAGINASAIFAISDNTIAKKSLYSGRTAEDKARRQKTKSETIPQIVVKLFSK